MGQTVCIHVRETHAPARVLPVMACPDGPTDLVLSQIEDSVRSVIAAINANDFTSSAWDALAEDFQARDQFNATSKTSTMANFARIREQYASYWTGIEIESLVSDVYFDRDGEKKIRVYMNAERTGGSGLEGGMNRKTVSVVECEMRAGWWVWVSETTMDGI